MLSVGLSDNKRATDYHLVPQQAATITVEAASFDMF